MLKTIGLYIPFAVVILGIGACSFIYKDTLLGFSKKEEPVENVPQQEVLPADVGPVEEESTIPEEVQPTEEEVQPTDQETDNEPELPGIGECVCPNSDGTLS